MIWGVRFFLLGGASWNHIFIKNVVLNVAELHFGKLIVNFYY